MSEFKLFQKVLVRDEEDANWRATFYSHYEKDLFYPHICVGNAYILCIPYEGNEHLVGTSDAPEKKWEPRKGEVVAFRGDGCTQWYTGVFKYASADGKRFVDYLDNYWGECEPLKKHFPEAFIPEGN